MTALSAHRVVLDVEGVTPTPQGSMRAILVGGKPRVVPGGSNDSQKRLTEFRRAVADACRDRLGEGWVPWDGPVALAVTFWLPRPKSGTPGGHVVSKGAGDLDKLLRALLDGLDEGDLFVDDSRVVVFERVSKRYTHDDNPPMPSRPGVTVMARRLDVEVAS